MANARPTHLTAVAVPKTADGNYPIEVAEWLIPHEAIRRELARAHHALQGMDCVSHPWKAFGFRLWYCDFFEPSIHAHHDNEEQVVGPYFAKLGDKPVFGDTKNHKELLDQMVLIGKQATTLAEAATVLLRPDAATGDDKAAVTKAHVELRDTWAQFKEWMEVHLAEEERVWPVIYKKHGRAHQEACLQQILSVDMGKKGKEGKAFQYFFGSVVDGLGCYQGSMPELPPTPNTALHMEPWASKSYAEEFLKAVPWVPRTFIFPGWYKVYVTKWKALVDSLGGSENVTGVTPKGFPPANACCTVM